MVLSMKRWVGHIAVVTGASSGIGAGIAKKLVEEGMIVVGLARRKERIDELANNLGEKKKQFYSLKCDISHEQDILDAFEWITKKIGPLYVLVNSAGCFRNDSLTDGKTENMKQVVDTNLIGLTICCREAIRIMKENNIAGHIININSILGQHIPRDVINVSMYCPTKFAVRAVTETLRLELIHQDSPIKTTNICPGATETEISLKALKVGGYAHLFPENKMLLPEDVADAVTYALSTPPQVQIKELTLKPLTEKF